MLYFLILSNPKCVNCPFHILKGKAAYPSYSDHIGPYCIMLTLIDFLLSRKHSRLVEGLKGVDTEDTEEGFDEV